MILGLAAFVGGHAFATFRAKRAVAVARVGEWPYKGIFSLVALMGIVLICVGFSQYRDAGLVELWHPPAWTRHITAALMWPAVICLVAAYIRGDIQRMLKHPFLVGVKLWALAHLIANGDLGGIILFGSILAWAVFDRITLKRRSDPGAPAIPSGGRRNDVIAVVVGTLLYLALGFWFHPYLIGLPGRSGADMSAQQDIKRITAPDIRARKGGEPIVCLTSYHAHTARLVDRYCDVILVGDSLGMVMHGLETTVPVTLEMMILQGHAVMRGSQRALVVVDMPFGSYEQSREQAFASCARVLKETGCGAIKLEGGRRMAETISFLVERGVPVMGHVGLTPQSINTIGAFRAQGRDEADWAPIEADAQGGGGRRRLRDGDRGGGRAARAPHQRSGRDPDHRDRRQRRLRRPDPGARGHARPVAAGAEIRQALRRISGPASKPRSRPMPRTCVRAPFRVPSTSTR